MAHTNSTQKLQLAQFVATDKPTWLGDWNSSMLTIDTAVGAVQDDNESIRTSLQETNLNVTSLEGDVETVEGDLRVANMHINKLNTDVTNMSRDVQTLNDMATELTGLKIKSFTIPVNGLANILVENSLKAIIVFAGVLSSGKGMYIATTRASGESNVKEISAASGIVDISTSGNKQITIQNGGNLNTMIVIVLSGDCTIL